MDTQTMFKLTYGMFVLTSAAGDNHSGCIINTAGQVTETPNRITIAVNSSSYTCELLRKSGIFNLSILSEDASFDTYRHFGFQSGRTVDKFAGYLGCERGDNGLYYLTEGCNGCISGKVEQAIDLGSHILFIAGVEDMKDLSGVPSATYTYYQEKIKPKPKAQAAEKRVAWRCRICGYVYEGEALPADFICPLCKHPASDFEKIYI